MTTQLLSTTNLIGRQVENGSGENLGKIEDLVIDWQKGKVSYAVLSFGGFLGIGNKYFAVPLQSFSISNTSNEEVLILSESKERLENSPGFNKDNWPNSADYDFTKKVYEHYKQEYF